MADASSSTSFRRFPPISAKRQSKDDDEPYCEEAGISLLKRVSTSVYFHLSISRKRSLPPGEPLGTRESATERNHRDSCW